MSMTPQVKDAIEKMLKSGFKRSEFSCRAQRLQIGYDPVFERGVYEIGHAVIEFKNVPKQRQYTLIPAMIKSGLRIEINKKTNGDFLRPFIDPLGLLDKEPGLYFRDFGRKKKDGRFVNEKLEGEKLLELLKELKNE